MNWPTFFCTGPARFDDIEDLYAYAGRERDANAFAGHVLVPTEFLSLSRDRDRPQSVEDFDELLLGQRRAQLRALQHRA
jgi:Zn-dependent peptidase ImmA (M78 family)